jgi:hypothetical protein
LGRSALFAINTPSTPAESHHFRGSRAKALAATPYLPRCISRCAQVAPLWGAVCAAVRAGVTGTAPPSSSHRLISRRGNLARSFPRRLSRVLPRARAPITRKPIVQFIAPP